MSKKRFTLAYEKGNWWAVRDGDITLWKEETIATLNELYEENEQLKKENEQLKERINILECANDGLTETIAHYDIRWDSE